ncbi:hypothetical protein STAPHY8AQ_21162 [Staphylococcus sp. 8AQ]|nr:hypothetical protein STAPHY8AQ_21162 [Staphylococcus sp. 8AQ]
MLIFRVKNSEKYVKIKLRKDERGTDYDYLQKYFNRSRRFTRSRMGL